MIVRTVLIVLFGQFFFRPVAAAIPSFRNITAPDLRGELSHEDFLIRFRKSVQTIKDGKISKFASASDFPALGLPDVQIGMEKITLFANKTYSSHSHPRASETLFILRGEVKVLLALEGPKTTARVIKNFLTAGDTAVTPQGLSHSVKCVGRRSCNLLAFYNSADPGSTIGNKFSEYSA